MPKLQKSGRGRGSCGDGQSRETLAGPFFSTREPRSFGRVQVGRLLQVHTAWQTWAGPGLEVA